MKSWNPTVNASERMDVLKKTIQAPFVIKRGSTIITKKDNTSNKRPRKEKTRSFQKIVNVGQPMVETPCGH
jgi:hypothetical protein